MKTVQEYSQEFASYIQSEECKKKLAKEGLIAAGVAGVTASVTPIPAHASVNDVSSMITSLGGIAAAVTTVVLGAMGVRYAIKLVNRVGVKG